MESRVGESVCLRTDDICTKIYSTYMPTQVNLQVYGWQDNNM